ncbi:MAG: glycosyl hydrolase, partial [Candidatus Aminicenantales bacterium]
MPRSTMKTTLFVLAGAVAAALATWTVFAQTSDDALVRGFQNPPDSAKPRVWWHWMSGNITKEGIKADLEWMKRAGIAGFQNFDAGLDTPQIVKKRLVYMTPEWKDAFKYTVTLADQLGLEMAIAGSPGWSESGGPWVTPAQAMKKYVWSETRVEGGRPFSGMLPKPPSTTGPYQNMGTGREKEPVFYADSAVVAFRVPDSDRTLAELGVKVTSSGGSFDLNALTDGDVAKGELLPAAPAGEKAWIQLEFPRPQIIRGLTLMTVRAGRRGNFGDPELESSDDGRDFRSVLKLPTDAGTIAFTPLTAKFFRVSVPTMAPRPGTPQGSQAAPDAPAGIRIAELVLHTASPVNRFQDKAAFDTTTDLYALATPDVPDGDAVRQAEVVDLTSKMRPDGRLDWTPPAGRWTVLRFGYSLTGARNSPASPEATGLEVDKLDRAHVKAYFDNYLDQYKSATGGLMGKRGLQYVVTDSWEAGTANWTDRMFAEFAKRRGYDMHPWLPVLAGRIVDSAETSDRFLWDFRKTLADLVAENHYDQLTDILHARGMGRYTESHEGGRAFI